MVNREYDEEHKILNRKDARHIHPESLEMNWWEKNVEFLHLYRSIAFIKKYPPIFKDIVQKEPSVYIIVGNIQKPKKHKEVMARRLNERIKNGIKKILLMFMSQDDISRYKNKLKK